MEKEKLDLLVVFAELRKVMDPYSRKLVVTIDSDYELSLDTHHIQPNKKPLFFGAVQVKKNYVSYHLMPVYVQPKLLEAISPELRKRMQGKSCFNFTTVDPVLVEELAALTAVAYQSYQEQGFVEGDK